MQEDLGISPAILHELTRHFGTKPIKCPGCGHNMSGIVLAKVSLEWCLHCGGMWLDRGELKQLSGGKHEELSLATARETPTYPERVYQWNVVSQSGKAVHLRENWMGTTIRGGVLAFVIFIASRFVELAVGTMFQRLGMVLVFTLPFLWPVVALARSARALDAQPGRLVAHYGFPLWPRRKTWTGQAEFTWDSQQVNRNSRVYCLRIVQEGEKWLLVRSQNSDLVFSLGSVLSQATTWKFITPNTNWLGV